MNKEECWYAIGEMDVNDLYNVLCEKLSFDKMIKLYKLIKHKMEYLEDEPIITCSVYSERGESNVNTAN